MTAGASDDRSEEAAPVERDNGLEADTFVFLGSVEASRSDELLDDLAAEGIAAYAESGDPDERLYVDGDSLGYAEALLRRSGAAVSTDEDADGDDGDDDPDEGDDDPAAETDDGDKDDDGDDEAWERIVADFDRDGDDDRPWPDAEHLADDADAAAKDKDTESGDSAADDDAEERTVGKNKAKVSVIRLDTDEEPEEDDTDHYVKPPPPPLPKGDVWTKGAWVVMLAALAYPITGLILDWDMPGWSLALAVVAFIAGIVTHVIRLRDPRAGDGPDDGAVV